jgi:transposase
MLSRWVREYREETGGAFPAGEGTRNPTDKRIYELETEVRRLRMEREILKKAMAYFVEPPK